MTTSTTNDHPPPPDTKLAALGIEPPTARKPEPELTVVTAASTADLQSRIQQRRAELIARLTELKAGPRLATTEVRDRMKARLSELAQIIRVGVVDGWTNLCDTVKRKLEHWLSDSERTLRALPATKR